MPTPGKLKVGRSQVQSNRACPASSRLGSALEKTPLKASKLHLLLSFPPPPHQLSGREKAFTMFFISGLFPLVEAVTK